ncbi:MAG: hypothetical protein ABJZ55_07600 [Fuerstiella sp.]
MRISFLGYIALFPIMSSQSIAQQTAFNAWQERSSSTKSLELTWQQISKHHKAPSNPITFGAEFVTSRIDLSRQWRFDRVSFAHYREHGFLAQRCVTTIDSQGERTNFFPQGERSYATASIATNKSSDINHLRLLPIAVLYFPFDVKSWAIGEKGSTPLRSAPFLEADCHVYQVGDFEVWVKQADKESIPVRLTKRWDDGSLRYDFHINAESAVDGTVRLSHWSFKHLGPGGDELKDSKMRVESCKINTLVDATPFSQLPFPKNTRVSKDGLVSIVQVDSGDN